MVENSARCRIKKEELSGKEIIEILSSCRSLLERSLTRIHPKVIVVLGDFALRQVLKKSKISKHRGRWYWSEEFKCWVLPAYHPAYIARNPGLEQQLQMDLELVRDFVKNGYQPPTLSEAPDYRQVASIRPLFPSMSHVGFDTETQGLDSFSPNFVLISYSVSPEVGRGYQVRLHQECPVEEAEFTIQWPRLEGRQHVTKTVGVRRAGHFNQKVQDLRDLLEDAGIKKYMFNGVFDIVAVESFFKRIGQPVPTVRSFALDAQVCAHLLDENVYKNASLFDVQMGMSHRRDDYNGEFAKRFGKADMLSVPSKDMVFYACSDADVTLEASLYQREQLLKPENKRMANYAIKMAMPMLRVIKELKVNGACIDLEQLPRTTDDVRHLMGVESENAKALIPPGVQKMPLHAKKGLALTRRELIRDVLFSSKGFKIPVYKQTRSRAASTDKEVLKMLLEAEYLPLGAKEFILATRQFYEYHTLWSRYLKGFRKHVRSDGRIHSDFSSVSTVTGRLSSSNPNMQNNPKRSKSAPLIRRLIVAPPGKLLMAADAGQAELRWAAHLSADPTMIRIFMSGEDIHTNTARGLVNQPWGGLTAEEKKTYRRNAKAVNFGLLYLMSPPGFVRYAKLEYDLDITMAESEAYIRTFFSTYPGLRRYHQHTIEFGRSHGYVVSPLGRVRHLPSLNSPVQAERSEAERMAVNHKIQGPSSDTVLLSAHELLKEDIDPDDFRLVLFVHDELVFEVKDSSRVADYGKLLHHHMIHPPLKRDFGLTMRVPLESDVTIGKNYAEMKPLQGGENNGS